MKYERIRALREDKDLTQTQMGKVLSCSQRVYSNYERGELDIPNDILIKLADFHNIIFLTEQKPLHFIKKQNKKSHAFA